MACLSNLNIKDLVVRDVIKCFAKGPFCDFGITITILLKLSQNDVSNFFLLQYANETVPEICLPNPHLIVHKIHLKFFFFLIKGI